MLEDLAHYKERSKYLWSIRSASLAHCLHLLCAHHPHFIRPKLIWHTLGVCVLSSFFFLWGIPSIISDLKADVRDRRTATRALVPKLGLLWEAQLVQTSSLCCSHSGSLSAEKRGDFVMETQLCWVKLFVTYRSWGNWVFFFLTMLLGYWEISFLKQVKRSFEWYCPHFPLELAVYALGCY